uniref:Uncharacterized protein n=1 Tax=Trichuris muris TaxID=70415 RepID=A0A5S6Q4X6_TRIMR
MERLTSLHGNIGQKEAATSLARADVSPRRASNSERDCLRQVSPTSGEDRADAADNMQPNMSRSSQDRSNNEPAPSSFAQEGPTVAPDEWISELDTSASPVFLRCAGHGFEISHQRLNHSLRW